PPPCGGVCRVPGCRGGAGRPAPRAEVLGRQEQGRREEDRGEAQVPAAAVREGTAVDPACPTTAETKFDQSIAKAEARGRFAVSGDGATIEAAVDSCVDSLVTLTSPTSPTTTPPPPAPGCC